MTKRKPKRKGQSWQAEKRKRELKPKRETTKKKKKTSESTAVRLKIGDDWYAGRTGRGHGHAEMDALHNFIEDQGGVEDAIVAFNATSSRKVECLAKPVCKRCRTILEGLEFTLSGTTKWGTKSMGSTQWGASMNVKAFLAHFGFNVDSISNN